MPNINQDPIQNKKKKIKRNNGINYNLRLMIVLFLFTLLIAIVGVGRVGYIKLSGKEYEKQAIYQQLNKVQDKVISPNRGDIIDRNGDTLALGETVFNIILDVRLLVEQNADNQKKTIDSIVSILGVPETEIKELIALDSNGVPKEDSNYYVLRKKVSFAKGKAINDLKLNWLYAEQDTKRTYPGNSLAAQVIGFGNSLGIEGAYNSYMTGVPGRTFRTYEEGGSVVTQRETPIKGDKVVTTLDSNIQKIAEKVCKEAYKEYEPEYTATMVMNPKTGEVYAMAQYPTFDLNDPMKITPLTDDPEFAEQWKKMSEKEQSEYANKIWKNVFISETMEPGSIYKPVVVAMALEEGVITEDESFFCGGSLQVAEYTIHCHNRAGHGTLSLSGVLAQSCNVGMMRIITKVGAEKYLQYQHDFGFGEKSGIDLPNEVDAEGLLYTLDRLNEAEMATSSFGQGFNCTPLQAMVAFGALINGGNVMQPYVVSRVLDGNNNIVFENTPKVVRNVISKSTSDYLRTSLEQVLTEGTGQQAVIKGYRIGGKTGTAQQGDRDLQRYGLSFIAYHSVEDPDIMAMTIIFKPKDYDDSGGEATPVPMMKELMESIIDYEAIPPDDESEAKDNTAQSSYTVKDYTNTKLKNTVQELINEGIDFEIIGSGDVITKQSPAAGTQLDGKPAKILFNISKSNEKVKLVPVPDVTGLTVDAAQKMLEESGFSFSVESDADVLASSSEEDISEEDSEEEGEETFEEETEQIEEPEQDFDISEISSQEVYVQMPSANVKVEEGTVIKIRVK